MENGKSFIIIVCQNFWEDKIRKSPMTSFRSTLGLVQNISFLKNFFLLYHLCLSNF